ncbi:MAG TPA: DUF4215 domain-containing protein, partial [Myxococcota bacterium]|nr:DUF4215 domain-containing protein [Myxococcota bacterium]
MRSRYLTDSPLRTTVLCAGLMAIVFSSQALAGTITAQGAVTALTDSSQMSVISEGRFDEGPTSGNIPLGLYSSQGLTFRTGALTSLLPGVTTGGSATNPQYDTGGIVFPAPIAGGGEQTGAYVHFAGVATFSVPVTQVGLTASRNGTQYLTVWNTSGTMIGQVTWVPSVDSAFVGIDTNGVLIGMVAYGNDNLWGGASYSVSGSTIYSDTWVWGGCNNDGIQDGGEQCDDGNTIDGDGCSQYCRIEYCGNGWLDPGETCDDGNVAAGDGCSSDCMSDETCGNGYLDWAVGEACDDGNTTSGDGCQFNCALPNCGDGVVDSGETCDDGNNTDGDGCSATCTSDESCGNGIVDTAAGEEC